MNCEKATELVSLNCEQKLPLRQQMQVQLHLWICPKCRKFKANNQKLRAMMKAYGERK